MAGRIRSPARVNPSNSLLLLTLMMGSRQRLSQAAGIGRLMLLYNCSSFREAKVEAQV